MDGFVQFSLLFLIVSIIFAQPPPQTISPANMPRIGTVDERFQSYNVEMAEVVGGQFWKPYDSRSATAKSSGQQSASVPTGMNADMYEYRPPIDLSDSRLRNSAAALGPAYVRVSGTWANSVYFQDSDSTVAGKAPAGYSGVLTRKEWKGVIDFARAVNAEIVTSFAISAGSRNAQGVWTPSEAQKWLAYTNSVGGKIAAAEFINEPTYAAMGGAPKGYDASAYARDIAVFAPWLKKNSPDTLFLGPGSVGEGPFGISLGSGTLRSEDLLKATGPAFDIFSYHLYAAASQRCAALGEKTQTTAAAALSPEWLSRSKKINEFYANLRNQFESGKSLWITETADAACGGNPWASSFLDTFRYLIEHAALAQRGVKVIMHNTLASSDYGLLEQNTFEPRPNYWVTLLWRKLMGTTVIDPKISPAENVYTYAHCQRDHPGGVALLIINADSQRSYELTVPVDSKRYTLSAENLQSKKIELNGQRIQADREGNPPELTGQSARAGRVSFPRSSITILVISNAGNASCR